MFDLTQSVTQITPSVLTFSDNLPSEEVAKKLHNLQTLQLRHNLLTGKEPFYLPKFLLELTGWVNKYYLFIFLFASLSDERSPQSLFYEVVLLLTPLRIFNSLKKFRCEK